jgi:hypothetical protein
MPMWRPTLVICSSGCEKDLKTLWAVLRFHLSPPLRSPSIKAHQVLEPLKIRLELVLLSSRLVRWQIIECALIEIDGVR